MKRSAPKKLAFTKALIDRIIPPPEGRTYFYDDGDRAAPGLALCVTSAGKRVWYWYGRDAREGGRPRRVRIGRYPNVTIEQARTRAKAEAGKATDPEARNPTAERREHRASMTLGELFDHFKAAPSRRTKHAKRARTLAEYEKQWNAHLKPWAGRKLTEVTADDVYQLHQDIGKDHPYQANRVAALLHALYRLAKADRSIRFKGENPAASVDRFPEESKVRYLSRDEAARFMAAVKAEKSRTGADLLLVALYTGARRSNVCAMRWADVNLSEALWTIPADQAKGREEIRVALPTPAVAILKARRKAAEDEAVYVFPGRRGGRHVTEVKSVLQRVLTAAGIDDFRFHDLRHCAASWMVNAGVPLEAIGKQLGHRSLATTAKYAHVSLDATRKAAEAGAAAFDEAATPKPAPKRRKRQTGGKRKGGQK